MQEGTDENADNSVAASAAISDASSQHHSADVDVVQSDATRDEEPDTENNGGEYEKPDPREVEEARLRAQQPSVYETLQREDV